MKKIIMIFLGSTILCGIVYPYLISLVSRYFPKQATGSLIFKHRQVIGSTLLAQEFDQPRYFHARPSAVGYRLQFSGGDDLFLHHFYFVDQLKRDIVRKRKLYGLSTKQSLPGDMVLISASGLDPHISFENAVLQLQKVARVRHLKVERLYPLLYRALSVDLVGLWGNAGVNVLRLNLLLDNLENENKPS